MDMTDPGAVLLVGLAVVVTARVVTLRRRRRWCQRHCLRTLADWASPNTGQWISYSAWYQSSRSRIGFFKRLWYGLGAASFYQLAGVLVEREWVERGPNMAADPGASSDSDTCFQATGLGAAQVGIAPTTQHRHR